MKSAPDTQPTFPSLAMRLLMSEDEFQKWVTDLAELHGWSWHHEQDSRKSKAGFPDLIMWHPADGKLILAELKRQKDYKVTKEQHKTLRELGEAASMMRARCVVLSPVQVFLWRPSQMEEILEVLR